MPEHIGVTATRRGLTADQKQRARWALIGLRDLHGATTLHHGDCLGGDVDVAEIAQELGYGLISHPCDLDADRAYIPSEGVLPVRPPLQRNHDIVDAIGYLLGFPPENEEWLRSGTWATIRYARKVGRPRWIVGPAGDEVERQRLALAADTAREDQP